MEAVLKIKETIRKMLGIYKPYYIHKTAVVKKAFSIGKGTQIFEYVIIRDSGNISIGNNVQIGPFSIIFPCGGITIGNDVLIGPHCILTASNHDYKQTKIPVRFSGEISAGPIVIEDNVWIGANCTITDAVTIGHDAVIGANSVVTKNVKPYEIVGGAPAKHLGFRKTEHGG